MDRIATEPRQRTTSVGPFAVTHVAMLLRAATIAGCLALASPAAAQAPSAGVSTDHRGSPQLEDGEQLAPPAPRHEAERPGRGLLLVGIPLIAVGAASFGVGVALAFSDGLYGDIPQEAVLVWAVGGLSLVVGASLLIAGIAARRSARRTPAATVLPSLGSTPDGHGAMLGAVGRF